MGLSNWIIVLSSFHRSSKSSIQNLIAGGSGTGNGYSHNADRKTSIKNGQQQLKIVEEVRVLLLLSS